MYYYIFEAQRGPKDYERVAQIKELLFTLGIAGEMASPMPGKSVEALVKGAIAKRYSTVIAVGGIELVNQVAHALEPYDAVFGIIPTHEHPDIAHLIGAETWKTAAENLKRRRWLPIRMGRINESSFFISPVRIDIPCSFELRGPDYSLTSTDQHITIVANSVLDVSFGQEEPTRRNFIQSLFKKQSPSESLSHVQLDQFDLTTEREVSVQIAGIPITVTPSRFSLCDKEVKIIVGRGLSGE